MLKRARPKSRPSADVVRQVTTPSTASTQYLASLVNLPEIVEFLVELGCPRERARAHAKGTYDMVKSFHGLVQWTKEPDEQETD